MYKFLLEVRVDKDAVLSFETHTMASLKYRLLWLRKRFPLKVCSFTIYEVFGCLDYHLWTSPPITLKNLSWLRLRDYVRYHKSVFNL